MRAPISLKEYLMGRDVASPLTSEMSAAAEDLLDRVNGLLGILEGKGLKCGGVTSGYRPAAINAAVGGAKNSAHSTCQAIDVADPGNDAGEYLYRNWTSEGNSKCLLKSVGLYAEHFSATGGGKDAAKGWLHLQTRPTKSGNRVFYP